MKIAMRIVQLLTDASIGVRKEVAIALTMFVWYHKNEFAKVINK